MVKSGTNQQIGYILRSYPRLSQTFILNEILALEQMGQAIQIFVIAHPQEEFIQPQVAQIRAPVHYLNEPGQNPFRKVILEHLHIFMQHPIGYLRALSDAVRKREIDKGYTNASRIECFRMAVSLAQYLSEAGPGINHLHAHFAHDPTFIAQLVHRMTGITYSFTAHARDLFQVPRSVLVDRIHQARAVVTCCKNNLNYLDQIAPGEQFKFSMIYHGVNLEYFRPAPQPVQQTNPPLIVSVGRLIEKKGFSDLLKALQIVKGYGVPFRCQIYGEGPLRAAISQWIEERDLAGWVTLSGSGTQQEILEVFQHAAFFALTPSVTEDGDREGIPNVLVEAMAVGLPVISTYIAGIPELVAHDLNGLLYPAHDIEGIAAGIVDLLNHPMKRARLGSAAHARVTDQFDLARAAVQLKTLFSNSGPSSEVSEFQHASRPV